MLFVELFFFTRSLSLSFPLENRCFSLYFSLSLSRAFGRSFFSFTCFFLFVLFARAHILILHRAHISVDGWKCPHTTWEKIDETKINYWLQHRPYTQCKQLNPLPMGLKMPSNKLVSPFHFHRFCRFDDVCFWLLFACSLDSAVFFLVRMLFLCSRHGLAVHVSLFIPVVFRYYPYVISRFFR